MYRLAGLLVFCLLTVVGRAAPLPPEAVPDSLREWLPWVLHDDREWQCPFANASHERLCEWPSRLELKVDASGGEFSQHWQVYGETWVALPGGDYLAWPMEVEAGGQAVLVTERSGKPGVWLRPGSYTLTGRWQWDELPEYLPVPAATGLVSLTVDGEATEIPELDDTGRLWLRGKRAALEAGEAETNRLELRVYRRVIDEIPLQIVTRLELDVAGKPREVVLGPVLDSALEEPLWLPMSLDTVLPARMEPDGRLRVQVRPGSWEVEIRARRHGATTKLRIPATEPPWPEEEVWVFEARNHLRVAEVQGVTPLDPQQTGLPAAWRQFPAYRVLPSEIFTLAERRRGDPEPAPDQLSLERDLWLDFDGHGYTVHDVIEGSMSSGWRLEMGPPARLGRAAVNGEDQFITRLGDTPFTGIEVRHGKLNLEADSRIEERSRILPATGWRHDFRSLHADLHLPPGWRALHITGVDQANYTWLNRWNLLNLFVVLITALAIGKLWHWGWGVLALVALVSIYHEPGAPRWVFLNIIAALALLRVLPHMHWFTWWVRRYRDLSLITLLVVALPFMVQQARQSIYPQLEHNNYRAASSWQAPPAKPAPPPPPAAEPMENFAVQQQMQADAWGEQEEALDEGDDAIAYEQAPSKPTLRIARATRSYDKSDKIAKQKAQKKLLQIDPDAQVQTGPGLPNWHWHTDTIENVDMSVPQLTSDFALEMVVKLNDIFKKRIAKNKEEISEFQESLKESDI